MCVHISTVGRVVELLLEDMRKVKFRTMKELYGGTKEEFEEPTKACTFRMYFCCFSVFLSKFLLFLWFILCLVLVWIQLSWFWISSCDFYEIYSLIVNIWCRFYVFGLLFLLGFIGFFHIKGKGILFTLLFFFFSFLFCECRNCIFIVCRVFE